MADLKDRLQQMSKLAQEALGHAHQQQKENYDRKVKVRIFQLGQKVLL